MLREEVKSAACVATILHRRIHRHSRVLHRAIHHLALAHVLCGAHATTGCRVGLHWIVCRALLVEDRDTVLDNLRLVELLPVVLVLVYLVRSNAWGCLIALIGAWVTLGPATRLMLGHDV